MPFDQSRIIDQARFTYYPLGQAFEKTIKTVKDRIIKQVEELKALKPKANKEDKKSVEGIFPKDTRTNEMKNEIKGNKTMQMKS